MGRTPTARVAQLAPGYLQRDKTSVELRAFASWDGENGLQKKNNSYFEVFLIS